MTRQELLDAFESKLGALLPWRTLPEIELIQ